MTAPEIVTAAIREVLTALGEDVEAVLTGDGWAWLDPMVRLYVVEHVERAIGGYAGCALGDADRLRTVGEFVQVVERAMRPPACGRCGERLEGIGRPCALCAGAGLARSGA